MFFASLDAKPGVRKNLQILEEINDNDVVPRAYVAPSGREVQRKKEVPQVLDPLFPTCRRHCLKHSTNEKRSDFEPSSSESHEHGS